MRRFIIDILVVFTCIIFSNILLYFFFFNKHLYQDYESFKTELKIKENGIFIFSDSHGGSLNKKAHDNSVELTQKLIENNIYNFSYGSDSYTDILTKLRWLINNGYYPKTILLSVDDHMLTKMASNKNRSVFYANDESFSIDFQESIFKYYYYYFVRYFPMAYPSNQKLLSQFIFANTMHQDMESVGYDLWSSSEKTNHIKLRMNTFFKQKQNKRLKNNLKEIVDLCKDNNINIIGIKFPLDAQLSYLIDREGYSDVVLNIIRDLGVKEFLNFRDVFQDAAYFSNADHINSLGAEYIVDLLIYKSQDTITFSN